MHKSELEQFLETKSEDLQTNLELKYRYLKTHLMKVCISVLLNSSDDDDAEDDRLDDVDEKL